MQVGMQVYNVSNLRAHVSNDIFYIPKTFEWINIRQCILSRCARKILIEIKVETNN